MIGRLTDLQRLDLHNNQLTELPAILVELPNLHELELSGNPLAPPLASAYESGLAALRSYLRGLA